MEQQKTSYNNNKITTVSFIGNESIVDASSVY